MKTLDLPEPAPRRNDFKPWMLLLAVLSTLPGCGPPKEERAVDALNRGFDYDVKGEHDNAIANFTEAIRLNPKDAKAYQGRGAVYHNKGEQAKAEADFAKAKELGYKPE